MIELSTEHQVLTFVRHGETVRIEPWGADSVRVRAARARLRADAAGALLDAPRVEVELHREDGGARLVNGRLTVHVADDGRLRFTRTDDGAEMLAEQRMPVPGPAARQYVATGNGYHRLEQRFAACDGERLYGLGQHPNGRLDQKGSMIDLVQLNTEVSIPFLLSSRGYGFLWNNPGIGRVELGRNGTRWMADSSRQFDYWLTVADSPAGILANYADATGHPCPLPEWATGFWQSKLRYRSQQELLSVAREYRRRNLPLSVIVCDFFHWPHLGDWCFDPQSWPDPAAMVAELAELGVRLAVSVWPAVTPMSRNYAPMLARNLLVWNESGTPGQAPWPERTSSVPTGALFYDPTNAEARRYIWEQVRTNYHRLGIKTWWLDACEPEVDPPQPENLLFAAGPGIEIGNIYPHEHARGFHEGMVSAGESDFLSLIRSAWAGTQRYAVALWSADIPATFESLANQVRAGLNVALSGMPWWTTDVGGFHGGDPDSAYFRELIIRWFQFGVFCPLLRLHGFREPRTPVGPDMTGGPNEVWSFGDQAYAILSELLTVRERMRPYIGRQARLTVETGVSLMRPAFVDFPHDRHAWEVEDQFMFGSDLLVAPVTGYGATSRNIYLPVGATWRDAWTGRRYPSGSVHQVEAPLSRIPVFVRDDSAVPWREPPI